MSTKKQAKLKSFRSKMLETRQQSLNFFSGADYRYESLGLVNGCNIINDSSSTDLGATLAALEMTSTPVHLILGNVDTNNLVGYVGTQIRLKVVTLGVFGDHDYTIYPDILNLVDKATYSYKLEDVVANMINWLKPGETLLFSPACPGLELYESFKQRALHFNKIIEPHLN